MNVIPFSHQLSQKPWKWSMCKCGSIVTNEETGEIRGCTCDE